MQPLSHAQPLDDLFAGVTEQTFMTELGLTDVQLIDYISHLLARFVHRDAIYSVKDPAGRRLRELTAMMAEAEKPENKGEIRREIYRHMGDFTLFWTGVYPEALQTRSHRTQKEALVNYFRQGKRSYYLASTFADTKKQSEEAPVLRRLSECFEVCAEGLHRVRWWWEHPQG